MSEQAGLQVQVGKNARGPRLRMPISSEPLTGTGVATHAYN